MNATPHADLFSRDGFRRGVTLLGELGYSYDSWHYHFQNDAFTDLAIACSGTTIVLDHFGTPCGVGDFAGEMAAVFDQWKSGHQPHGAVPQRRGESWRLSHAGERIWLAPARPPAVLR